MKEVVGVGGCSLPSRQLRKFAPREPCAMRRSLPSRQLRNTRDARQNLT
ncbi:hypothetical protein DDI_3465 [Dickeya dianthicola RNS04.9]|nr:hypothetical protein DDI_3465 [Dickeya dianthicola RNS04.9]